MDFNDLARQCAPDVHPRTLAAIVRVESGFNPFAIGVVNGQLVRQPSTALEAIATARALAEAGYNFSVGLAQVNRHNLPRYGLSINTAFEPCANLQAGAAILRDCFLRANKAARDEQNALRTAFSCYYSGDFHTGFRKDLPNQVMYVQRVTSAASQQQQISSINPSPSIGKP